MDLAALTAKMNVFVQSKGWYDPDSLRPQEPSNLAQALIVECAEVLELFAWDRDPEREELRRELADVALYLLQIASVSGIDLEQAILEKLDINQDRHWDR